MADQSPILIMPHDDDTERLRKKLQQLVKDPRVTKFEQLRADGLDSETAAELSGLSTMTPQAQLEARLSTAKDPVRTPIHDAVEVAAYEIPHALRSIGSAAGSATGAAIGSSMVVIATKYANAVGIIVGTAIVAGASVGIARFVNKQSGICHYPSPVCRRDRPTI